MTDKPSIYEALADVMGDVRAVHKDGTNPKQGYKFRGIDGVVNAVGPVLRKHRVIVVPDVRTFDYGTVHVGSNQTPMGHARVVVAYTFHGPAGDHIVSSAAGEAFDSGDKATPKAMSVAFRTALLQALALPTDEPDPDATSYERAAPADPRVDLINEVAVAAKASGVGTEAVLQRWAGEHDGEHIKDATDLDALRALRDELRDVKEAT